MLYLVMVRCPIVDRAVSTGIICDLKRFSALCEPASLLCPECGNTHQWSAADAWLRDPCFAEGKVSLVDAKGG